MNSMFTETTSLLPAGAGPRADFPGLENRVLLRGAGVGLVEHTLAPRALGAPVHTHEHEDEISYVVCGRVGVQVGDEVVIAGPGDTVFKPRGVPHAFWNAGDQPARILETITPGGFEDYFADQAPLLAAFPPDPAALGATAARYGLTMEMDSVPRLVAEHGLTGPPTP